MPTPIPKPTSDDATGALLRREAPGEEDNLDAKLQLARLRRKLAGAEVEPVRFRRWEIVHRIGKGGMGSVYLARDPELDRLVALKVLNAGTSTERSANAERMRREAQALARIRHDHVVKVHQVDPEGGRTVIEMEYLQGETLRAWQAEPRPWRDVVKIYADVADGLAAIHAAGLVHRDVKPDNLLLATDGRVKVVDLGLAVGPRVGKVTDPVDARSLLSAAITQGSSIAGTPEYMAPERFGRSDATASADQFSFAVALYEALHGVRPFPRIEGERYIEAIQKGRLVAPSRSVRLPRWLRSALRQALSFDPSLRHRSMEDLATTLRRGLARRGWWLVGSSIVLGAAALTGLGWAMAVPPPDPCAALEQGLVAEANQRSSLPALRQRVRRDDTEHVARALELFDRTWEDAWGRWQDQRLDLCEAERRADVSDALPSRLACLEETRARMDATIADLASVDRDLAARLVEATKDLERIPGCDQPDPSSNDPAEERLRAVVDEALDQERAGDLTAAEATAHAAVDASVQHPRVHAEALYRLGHVLGALERGRESFDTLRTARDVALSVGYDELMCDVVALRAKVASVLDVDPRWAADDVGFAAACLERTEPRSVLVRADMLEARGLLAQAQGAPDRAIRWHEQALALRRAHLGAASDEVDRARHNLANALTEAGEIERAQREFERLLLDREATLGPRHPKVGMVWFNLGTLLQSRGELEAARFCLGHALELARLRGEGRGNIEARIHLALGLIERDEGDLAAASARFALARSGLEDYAEQLSDHPDWATLLQAEGTIAVMRGDFSSAHDAFAAATGILRRHDRQNPNVLDGTLKELEALAGLGDHSALARRVAAEGQPLARHLIGVPASDRGALGWWIGESSLVDDRPEQALTYLWLAHRAYDDLGDSAAVAELELLMQQAAESAAADQRP